jgi:multimeric flavodoxin WrbA
MKVLGIAGSPRRSGNTDLLLAEAMKCAAGNGAEVRTIDVCDLDITPCRHCDDCLETGGCSIDDDMQSVYREIEWADRLVLASPLFFMGITAQMKAMIDRCQALWARKYQLMRPPLGDLRRREGIFIGVGYRLCWRAGFPWHR